MMNISIRCIAAVIGFSLVCGPALTAAQDGTSGTDTAPAKERATGPADPAATVQRRADRAVLTLQQDALGRVFRPEGGQQARPLTPKDPEITKSPERPASFDIIRL